MRAVFLGLLFLAGNGAPSAAEPFHLIPGQVPADKGPDGNTIVLDAPKGLIVFDTGRHPEHAKAILDYAGARRRPIAAIVNSHWHLDHTTGNADIREVFPNAAVYQSNAVNGALLTFLANGRKAAEERLKDPRTPKEQIQEIKRFLDRMDHPDKIRPTRPVTASGRMRIAGRSLDVHLARFAATEGDVWIYDPKTHVAIVGDLVVGIVPFMDTACPKGWARALREIEATPFTTLVPGHGDPMTRTEFRQWKTAYDNFVDCGYSSRPAKECVEGWSRDASKFIDASHRDYVNDAANYYLTTRLRSAAAEQQRYCRPLRPS